MSAEPRDPSSGNRWEPTPSEAPGEGTQPIGAARGDEALPSAPRADGTLTSPAARAGWRARFPGRSDA